VVNATQRFRWVEIRHVNWNANEPEFFIASRLWAGFFFMLPGGLTSSLRADVRVRLGSSTSDDDDSANSSEDDSLDNNLWIQQCDGLAEEVQSELQIAPVGFNVPSSPVYEYLSLFSDREFHPHFSRLNPEHFSLLISIFTCAGLPMIFRLVLSAILSFLEFIDPSVIAESIPTIVAICLSFGPEMFTTSRLPGFVSLFAILSRSVQICGSDVLPLDFLGFIDYCVELSPVDGYVGLIQQIGDFLLALVDCDDRCHFWPQTARWRKQRVMSTKRNEVRYVSLQRSAVAFR
jgi:hypothetical protein